MSLISNRDQRSLSDAMKRFFAHRSLSKVRGGIASDQAYDRGVWMLDDAARKERK